MVASLVDRNRTRPVLRRGPFQSVEKGWAAIADEQPALDWSTSSIQSRGPESLGLRCLTGRPSPPADPVAIPTASAFTGSSGAFPDAPVTNCSEPVDCR